MPNTLRGEAEFTVGQETYRLKFNWSAACEFEDASGRVLSDALMDLVRERLSAKSLRAMLWAGLREHHEEVTLKEAGSLIDRIGRKEAVRILGAALRYYFPELEEAERKETGAAGGNPPVLPGGSPRP